ncbi:MAG: Rhs family protein, partial [Gammaproteobacteria bacterium]|nr:Rhs family protein [Gammaproteobacteria bacterium]NIR99234.1 Rhs family protein [Gammaproteobacteria bacterium]NIT64849.1 Rhs family protein [Gammaproteobacteria bacterium]NIV21811.1 Rhs family protein [Gammaproteobacteria bacterium]NIY33429.1 Rhs family protein [Gammaproteobacteria bacterium]
TEYTYDALDRVQSVRDADGRSASYHYDAAGRLARVLDSVSGETRYTYDILDRLTAELSDRGLVQYAYNGAGQLVRRTVNGAEATTYAYDAAGRVTDITHNAKAVHYAYNQAGDLTALTLPNGIRQAYEYDERGALGSIVYTSPTGAELDRLDYEYDAAGQRIRRSRAQGASVPETPFTATYDADNRMLTYNGHGLTYDENGNLTERQSEAGPVTYTWDARDRLTAIDGPNGHASFTYDHAGRRIEATINGQTTRYLYDGPQAVAELQGNALGAVYHTGLGIDEVLARYAAGGDRSLLTDALGSVIAQADEGGALPTTYGYSPFGEVATEGEASDNPLQYTGRENDGTGLYYYRARYYDPA